MAKQTTSRPRTPRARSARARSLELRQDSPRHRESRVPQPVGATEAEPRLGPYEFRYPVEYGYTGPTLR